MGGPGGFVLCLQTEFILSSNVSLNLKLNMTCAGYVPIRLLNVDLRHPACIKNFKQPPFTGEMVLYILCTLQYFIALEASLSILTHV